MIHFLQKTFAGELARFVYARFLVTIAMLVALSFIVFGLMEMVPGNCAERYIAYKVTAGQVFTAEDVRAEEIRMGLDRPFLVRWVEWISDIALRFDFGKSCIFRADISVLVGEKFLLSMGVTFLALFVTYLIAVPMGMVSALIQGGAIDNTVRFISYLGLALPNFFIALGVMVFSTIYFGKTLTGLFSPEFTNAPWSWAKVKDLAAHAWLPIFVLGWAATAFQLQTVRALMLDEKDKLYVTAARARGVHGRKLFLGYPARHALSPVINSVGYDLNRIFGDLPIVATILLLTDAGSLLLEALTASNDQLLAGAIILLMTSTIVTLNFLTDILLALVDPRIRKSFLS